VSQKETCHSKMILFFAITLADAIRFSELFHWWKWQ